MQQFCLSDNAHILWYTTHKGAVNSAWLGEVEFSGGEYSPNGVAR